LLAKKFLAFFIMQNEASNVGWEGNVARMGKKINEAEF
jgi:hypothetical protein